MKLNQFIYCIVSVLLLSSCSQWKSITARDNSSASTKSTVKRTQNKDPKFLDISVSPGQIVTTKHPMSQSMPPIEKRKREREVYNAAIRAVSTSTDIEKVDWLQLKYAIVLLNRLKTASN